MKDGKFHIYPVSIVDEAIEILTGCKAGLQEAENEEEESNDKSSKESEEETLYDIISERLYEIDNQERTSIFGRILKKIFHIE